MKTCADCILCLLTRDLAAVPEDRGAAARTAYLRDAMRCAADSDPALSTPELSAQLAEVFNQHFGERRQKDFDTLKRIYNERMLALEPQLRATVAAAPDPLADALRLARVGNYIDFAGRHTVSDDELQALLDQAHTEPLDAEVYAALRSDLARAGRVLYLTDNAGEIVLDKLLIGQLQAQYPDAAITVLVRGAPILNDATLDDAHDVGLTDMAPVLGNGNGYPGTVRSALSAEAVALLDGADVILSKGQANFETLSGCRLNVYYLLLCKCPYFVRRFGVPRLTGMFVNERRLPTLDD